ncbi:MULTISPECIES: ABC transporter substrate-binding protein [Marinovum]|uniref:ABC transporter substrate-binding protein n=1 Tax=Marinovum TaxID=367771 RepID=UPI00237A7C65|nr:extracellular solute-binding protein [Marinovum sp. PR37]MDD9746923.1 extracellular solute-binding protein [Marinovum sp. PR37]
MTDTLELRGMTWDHPRGYDCLVAASERYARETGVRIHWKKRTLQAFADQSIADLAAENDFLVLDHPHVGQIAESRSLMALPAWQDVAAGSMGGSVESYVYGGQTWAWPIDAACQMAVIRPDSGLEMPHNWEEFLTPEARRFRAITPLLPVDAFDMLMTLVAARGEEVLPVSKDAFVSDANGIAALDLLKTLYNLGPPEACEMNPIRVLELLATEQDFAMSPCLFGYVNYARPGFRPHQLRYVDLPVFVGHGTRRGILGGAGIGVSAQTKASEAALDFVRWVTSEPVQSGIYLENEGQPAHRQTWKNRRSHPAYAGFFDGAFDTMANAWTRPRDDWFLHFVDDICAVMSDFFLRGIASDDFLKQINTLYRHHITKG